MVFDSNPFLRVNSKVIFKKNNEIKICSWLEIGISRSKWNQLEKKKIYFCSNVKEIIILLEKIRDRISKISGIVSTFMNFVHVKLRIDRMDCRSTLFKFYFTHNIPKYIRIFLNIWISNRIVFFFFFLFCARARCFKLEKKIQFHFTEIKYVYKHGNLIFKGIVQSNRKGIQHRSIWYNNNNIFRYSRIRF